MEYLKSLNKAQKEAVLHTEGPLLIVAGAGAGKTRTLVHRIAYLVATGVRPASILAVTFTNKAAEEMRDRVRKLLPGREPAGAPLVATFHSLCVRILREFSDETGIPKNFVIWDRDDSVRAIKAILRKLDIEWSPRGVLETISRAKGRGLSREEFEKDTHAYREHTVVHVWEAYEKMLREEGALDFDDLLARAHALLKTRSDVRSLLQARWGHIHIDEYQDTNRVQYELVRFLADERNNVCAVGDVDQCIYTWRNATIENLLSFEREFPNTKVVLLEENYRSTRTILTAANAIIAKNVNRVPKNLFTENETGEPLGLFAGENEMDEAFFIASTVARAIAHGTHASDIAVLYRNNFQSRAIEEAFLALNIPYRVLGTRFFERREVKDLLSYVRAALNPKSKNDIARIISTPTRGIGKTTLEKMLSGQSLSGAVREKVNTFWHVLSGIRKACETVCSSEALEYAAEASGLLRMYKTMRQGGGSEEAEERLANMRELVNLAARYDSMAPPEGVARLLEEAALSSEQDELRDETDATSLMTVHAAKGLEFGVVFVTGLEQGLFPHIGGGDDNRDAEEERRLFYVALTRAKKKVYLTYALSRSKWGTREPTTASEFLLDIDERLVEHAEYGEKEQTIT